MNMNRRTVRSCHGRPRGSAITLIAFVLLTVAALAAPGEPVRSATPGPGEGATPAPPLSAVTLTAEPMLGGDVWPGSWAAFRVTLANGGPAVEGDLRVTSPGRNSSTYRLPVQLPPGAHQEHYLYAPAGLGNRFDISLRSGETLLATTRVSVNTNSAPFSAFVVAERADALAAPITAVAGNRARIVNVRPEDLSPRVEPWSFDLLVWQDIDGARLEGGRLDALRSWLAAGGQLVVVAGSTGALPFAGLPADLLPFSPTGVVDVPSADLEAAFGQLPGGVTSVPAVAGPLERGGVLLQGGDTVLVARAPYGQGSVTIVAVDPRTPWLAGSPMGDTLWKVSLPQARPAGQPELGGRNDFLVSALASLPTVQLPRSEHLLLLMLAYMVAVGPLNYVLLRRRDRRELAWLTIPVTIVVFAVAAYGFGVALRGSSVVVNELSVVQGATGAEQGMADVHVGVFSPDRRTFNVRVAGAPLVMAGSATRGRDVTEERPLDVALGDHATLADFEVGFGSLRAFRAQAAVATPRVESDFALVEDRLSGTVTNASGGTLTDVSVVYGGAFARLGDMAPGESREVKLAAARDAWRPLWEQLYPGDATSDVELARKHAARRAVIQHLSGGWEWDMDFGRASGPLASGPVVLAWASEQLLAVDLGVPADQLGETLYVLAASAAASGPMVLSGGLMHAVMFGSDADEVYREGVVTFLRGGTATMEYRPLGLDVAFSVEKLTLRLSNDDARAAGVSGDELLPLPADQQPDQERPLSSGPRGQQNEPLPRVQLWDFDSELWVEFEPLDRGRTYLIPDPARYVDSSGALRVRFVAKQEAWFVLSARLEGHAE
jgi:hypothetical protein